MSGLVRSQAVIHRFVCVGNGHLVLQARVIESGRRRYNCPVACGYVEVLLQHEVHRGDDPGNNHVASGKGDIQHWGEGALPA